MNVKNKFFLNDDINANPDKAFYDEEVEHSDNALFEYIQKQFTYISRYENKLINYFNGRPINILELGAGTCTLSLTLSKTLKIKQGTMFDISGLRMRQYVPRICKILDITPPNFTYVEGDFSDLSCLGEAEYDLILFDASLHHSRSMWDMLTQCKARLAPDGLVLAQREQYLAPLTANWVLKRLIRSEEVLKGVSENAYFFQQYLYYIRACGFDVVALAAPENKIQKILFFLNGIVFSKWILIAKKSNLKIGSYLPFRSIFNGF